MAFEIKLSCNVYSLDKAKRALKRLAQRTEEAGKQPPSKLVAVFGTNHPGAHTALRVAREQDGIAIVPLATLGP